MIRPLLIVLLVVVLLAAACSQSSTLETPSTELTPTETPTEEPKTTVTVTPEVTATSSIEPSPTSQPTRTPAASATPIPSPTNGESQPTRQATLAPTATAMPTVMATPTPVNTVAPSGVTIDTFKANVEIADPGDTIRLEWSTTNAITVTLWTLAPTGQFSRFWTVDKSGTFDYTINDHERNQSTFALSATDGSGPVEMASVTVKLRCPDQWFFDNPPDICPAQAALYSSGAEQVFEHGRMIWVGGEDRIYVLFDPPYGISWNAYTDEWDPGEPDRDPSLNPPAGLFQPVRGFGMLWRTEPSLKDILGWAVSEEVAYPSILQRTSYGKYNETYISAADGNVWRLKAERSGWEKIPG